MEPPSVSGQHKFSEPEERVAFLSDTPRSGELSPFAQKLAAEAFLLLCSIVVFGSVANYADSAGNKQNDCSHLCKFHIGHGAISCILCLIAIVPQVLMFFNYLDNPWASPRMERHLMMLLTFWWVFGVACLSAYENGKTDTLLGVACLPNNKVRGALSLGNGHAPYIAVFFGWLAFFATILGAYKAYHAEREEEWSLHHAKVLSMKAAEDEPYANLSWWILRGSEFIIS